MQLIWWNDWFLLPYLRLQLMWLQIEGDKQDQIFQNCFWIFWVLIFRCPRWTSKIFRNFSVNGNVYGDSRVVHFQVIDRLHTISSFELQYFKCIINYFSRHQRPHCNPCSRCPGCHIFGIHGLTSGMKAFDFPQRLSSGELPFPAYRINPRTPRLQNEVISGWVYHSKDNSIVFSAAWII